MARVGRPKKDEKDKAKYHMVAVRLEDYQVFKEVFDGHPLTEDKKIADVLGGFMRQYAEKMKGHKETYDKTHDMLQRQKEIQEALERHGLKPYESTALTISMFSRKYPEMSFDEIIEENIALIEASQQKDSQ